MKRIKLTQGKFVIVDDEDYIWLNKNKLRAKKYRNVCYAARQITIGCQNKSKNIRQKQRTIWIHREIKEQELGRKLNNDEEIHHINGNGLDNRRDNLQIVTKSQHKMLGKKQKTHNGKVTSSKYKGVSWHKVNKKWYVLIQINRKRIYLGSFDKEIEAAKAYNQVALKHFGDFANLNNI